MMRPICLAGIVPLLMGTAELPAQPTTQLAAVVERVAQEVSRKYVDSTIARAIADSLRRRLRRGDYGSIASLGALCDTLNADLQRFGHDLHLRLVYSEKAREVTTATDTAAAGRAFMAQVLAEGRTRNFGFDQVARLPGNIGFIRLTTFFPLEHAREVADAAMRFVSTTDAVIVDLRGNTGGAPNMVGHLGRYFLDDTAVSTTYDRLTNRTTTEKTGPVRESAWFRGKPVYVLLDSTVFSAPEAFAFGLQARKRIVVVGERTRGGAHVTSTWPIDPHIDIRIPHQRGMSDWEGKGIAPDVPAAGARAHIVAQVEALRELLRRRPGASELTDERRAALARLDDGLAAERDSLLRPLRAAIAGRENEPASRVFKDVQVLTENVSAANLLSAMTFYGAALGVSCSHCHASARYEAEDSPKKAVARQMMRMNGVINGQLLAGMTGLRSASPSVNCITCHRGRTTPARSLP